MSLPEPTEYMEHLAYDFAAIVKRRRYLEKAAKAYTDDSESYTNDSMYYKSVERFREITKRLQQRDFNGAGVRVGRPFPYERALDYLEEIEPQIWDEILFEAEQVMEIPQPEALLLRVRLHADDMTQVLFERKALPIRALSAALWAEGFDANELTVEELIAHRRGETPIVESIDPANQPVKDRQYVLITELSDVVAELVTRELTDVAEPNHVVVTGASTYL